MFLSFCHFLFVVFQIFLYYKIVSVCCSYLLVIFNIFTCHCSLSCLFFFTCFCRFKTIVCLFCNFVALCIICWSFLALLFFTKRCSKNRFTNSPGLWPEACQSFYYRSVVHVSPPIPSLGASRGGYFAAPRPRRARVE